MSDYAKLSKEELINKIEELEASIQKMKESKDKGRKSEVLELLQEKKRITIKEIAEALGITDKNVSSQLSYLRKDGWSIGTDSKGRKFIEVEEA